MSGGGNPYHDKQGKFASKGGGGAKRSGADKIPMHVKQRVHDEMAMHQGGAGFLRKPRSSGGSTKSGGGGVTFSEFLAERKKS